MTKRLRRLIVLFGVSSLLMPCVLSCVPMRVSEIPEVTGRVHRGHDPVAGAMVRWQDLDWRKNATTVLPAGCALTNNVGEFAIAAKGRWGAATLVPADAVVKWRLQLEGNGEITVPWQQELVDCNS